MKNCSTKIAFVLMFTTLSVLRLFAQNGWVKINATGEDSLFDARSFTIGNVAYRGVGSHAGFNYSKTFQKYDYVSKKWTSITNYAGGGSEGDFSFVINGKGYVGGGDIGPGWQFKKDLWEYTPNAGGGTWTQKADFMGSARSFCASFAIGDTAYVGLGISATSNSDGLAFNDFYKFDAIGNVWYKIQSFPGTIRYDVACFTVGTKGYVGLGQENRWNNFGPVTFNDFFEYNPATGSWKAVSSLPATKREATADYSLCNKGFIALGYDSAGNPLQDFWSFDPNVGVGGTWTRLPDFGGPKRFGEKGFVIQDTLYLTGGIAPGTNKGLKDLWSYTPAVYQGIAVSHDTSICQGKSVVLSANGNSLYSWSPSTGLSNTLTSSPYIKGAVTSVTATPPNGVTTYTITDELCGNQATVSVTVATAPNLAVSASINPICSGKVSSLTASGATSYSWSPSVGLSSTTDSIVSATPTKTTIYTITGNGASCPSIGTLTITVNPSPVIQVPASPSICLGTAATLTASGATNYSWSPSTGLSASTGASVTANLSSPMTYTITGTDGNGCSGSAPIAVTVNIPTVVQTGTDVAINLGASQILPASGVGTYSWMPSTGLSCTNCLNPIASPVMTTKYFLTVTEINGCSSTDSITVDVVGKVFVPTAFSPNGDNNNDVLLVKGSTFSSFVFTIYDRWGKKVFQSYDETQGWDGTFNGKKLDPAVFVYYLQGTTITSDQVNMKGNVSLVK